MLEKISSLYLHLSHVQVEVIHFDKKVAKTKNGQRNCLTLHLYKKMLVVVIASDLENQGLSSDVPYPVLEMVHHTDF